MLCDVNHASYNQKHELACLVTLLLRNNYIFLEWSNNFFRFHFGNLKVIQKKQNQLNSFMNNQF